MGMKKTWSSKDQKTLDDLMEKLKGNRSLLAKVNAIEFGILDDAAVILEKTHKRLPILGHLVLAANNGDDERLIDYANILLRDIAKGKNPVKPGKRGKVIPIKG